ncbi:MAG TPA: hypothetical protein VFP37_13880 [Steroidobacteraceae bacterium]|nr:hypothetical protein [Steroidobacteraceae bacterium]
MRIDSLALQMRPRAPHEAADLGVRLCQTTWRQVYRCYLLVAVPMALLSLSLFEISPWWPALLMWWAKPWLDRSVLFVLARAAFGQPTSVRDLWSEQREVWWRRILLAWSWRRLSPWRSFTEAVYQLEGHGFFQLRKRILQLRRRHTGAAFMTTLAFWFAELGLALGLLSLVSWFGSIGHAFDFDIFGNDSDSRDALLATIAYLLAILSVEPFYVAAGFGMYLNRRAELEAWDIEQEFRRAFAS